MKSRVPPGLAAEVGSCSQWLVKPGDTLGKVPRAVAVVAMAGRSAVMVLPPAWWPMAVPVKQSSLLAPITEQERHISSKGAKQ
jgi:hypothetical protein